jgi:hypothetical protein
VDTDHHPHCCTQQLAYKRGALSQPYSLTLTGTLGYTVAGAQRLAIAGSQLFALAGAQRIAVAGALGFTVDGAFRCTVADSHRITLSCTHEQSIVSGAKHFPLGRTHLVAFDVGSVDFTHDERAYRLTDRSALVLSDSAYHNRRCAYTPGHFFLFDTPHD